jgi:hypothetical protein
MVTTPLCDTLVELADTLGENFDTSVYLQTLTDRSVRRRRPSCSSSPNDTPATAPAWTACGPARTSTPTTCPPTTAGRISRPAPQTRATRLSTPWPCAIAPRRSVR